MSESKRLRAYLRVHLAAGVGATTFRRLVEAFGDVDAVVAASPRQWRAVEGVGERTAGAMAAVTDEHVDEELTEARTRGAEVLCIEDEAYPAALKAIYDPPPVLYVRGRMEPADAVAFAVVGARRCTHYGLEQAERFAQLLGRAGLTVISGGARGIDTAAHRGAMTAGGRTIAVMGCGLSETYPPENSKLFEGIAADGQGAVISELPMRMGVRSGNFHTRNRIISGLSLGVLVVEAARRSGALITARRAAEQGGEVFALPGRVDSPLSRGANELIRDGAVPVQNLDDILEHLGEVGRRMWIDQSDSGPAAGTSSLTGAEAKLFAALADGPLNLDELSRIAGLDGGEAAAAMTMLVLKGAVSQRPGNVFARRAGSSGD